MKSFFIILILFIVLISINFNIFKKEQTLSRGKSVFLQLAPVDPRSLMQGDYMVLNYKIANELINTRINLEVKSNTLKNSNSEIFPKDGFLVLTINDSGVGDFNRFYSENYNLEPNEILLKYRLRGNILKLGAESFFFQEGQSEKYSAAKYGELKVSADGESILAGLRNERLEPM